MPNYRALARAKAKKYGLDPNIFERQISAESGFNPNAGSPAGARGIAQFMPGTARSVGVNLNDGRASDDLDGAARLMASYVKKYGSYEKALRAYNAGEGAIKASYGYSETNNYVKKILGGKNPGVGRGGGSAAPSTPTADTGNNRAQVALSLLGFGQTGSDADDLLSLALAARASQGSSVGSTPPGAAGGRTGGQLGANGRSIVGIGKLAQSYGLRVSEHPHFDKVDPVHAKGSYHYQNRAIDVSGDPAAMQKFARVVARRYGKGLAELIWRGKGAQTIDNGRRVPLSTFSGHTDHVHVAR